MTTEVAHTATEIKLVEMLTENTGRHFLDSGGAYGRNWERNQALAAQADDPVALWKARPEATTNRYWPAPTVDLFHYLRQRLEYAPALDHRFRRFDSIHNPKGLWDESIEMWLEAAKDRDWVDIGQSYYTYNFDNSLSQDIVVHEFEVYAGPWEEDHYVFLQIHGGCDARGGFTAPVIFKVTCESYAFGFDSNDGSVWCPNRWELKYPGQLRTDGTEDDTPKCTYSFDLSGGDCIDSDGSFGFEPRPYVEDPDDDRTEDYTRCPDCGTPLECAAPYAS